MNENGNIWSGRDVQSKSRILITKKFVCEMKRNWMYKLINIQVGDGIRRPSFLKI